MVALKSAVVPLANQNVRNDWTFANIFVSNRTQRVFRPNGVVLLGNSEVTKMRTTRNFEILTTSQLVKLYIEENILRPDTIRRYRTAAHVFEKDMGARNSIRNRPEVSITMAQDHFESRPSDHVEQLSVAP